MSHREKIIEVLRGIGPISPEDCNCVTCREVREKMADHLEITGEGKESTLGACRPSLILLDEDKLVEELVREGEKHGLPDKTSQLGENIYIVDLKFFAKKVAHALISAYKKGGITI